MQCESGGNRWATGSQGEMGLMQIHPRWHADATYDPTGNILAAYRISGGGRDFSAWSCA
jgi:soluble lytic murein transglycosylase-like protein